MNHKTDMQAELKRIASELRAYNPAADEYKGEHIHKVWAREIEAALAGQSAGDPIYQIAFSDEDGWCDAHKKIFDEHPDHMRRIVYTAPVAVSQSTGMADEPKRGTDAQADERELLNAWYEANSTGKIQVSDEAYRIVTETAALLFRAAAPQAEAARQDCPHGVDDGACKQCYGEAASGAQRGSDADT